MDKRINVFPSNNPLKSSWLKSIERRTLSHGIDGYYVTWSENFHLFRAAPLGPPHTVLKDTPFEGYTIPKDSTISFHLSSVLTYPSIWENPEGFHPERVLTEEGKKKEKEFFFPFSIGPRSCLGKHLAMMELFLFLGNLLQRFTFKIPPGCPKPSVERVHTGVTCQPHPYQVCVVPN